MICAADATLSIPAHAAGASCLATTRIHRIVCDTTEMEERVSRNPLTGSYNTTIVVWRGELWAAARVFFEQRQRSEIVIGKIVDWAMPSPHTVRCKIAKVHKHGFQDMRLWTTGDRLWGSATVADRVAREWPCTMVALMFNDDGDIIGRHEMPTGRDEKNWMPFADGRGWIYSVCEGRGNFKSVTLNVYDSMQHLPAPDFENGQQLAIRGGSQVIPYRDGYLAVVHERTTPQTQPIHYLHRFVFFDTNLSVRCMSQPWFITHRGIEFVMGIVYWNGEFVVSAGVNGCESVLARVSTKTVDDMVAAS